MKKDSDLLQGFEDAWGIRGGDRRQGLKIKRSFDLREGLKLCFGNLRSKRAGVARQGWKRQTGSLLVARSLILE